MTAISLPNSPTVGQEYVASNGVTYTFVGQYWSSKLALDNGTAYVFVEGGDSSTWSTPTNNILDRTIDGGTSSS